MNGSKLQAHLVGAVHWFVNGNASVASRIPLAENGEHIIPW